MRKTLLPFLALLLLFATACGEEEKEDAVPELIPPPDAAEIIEEHAEDVHDEEHYDEYGDPIPGSPADLEDGVSEVRLPEESVGAASEHPASIWFQIIYNAEETNGDVQASLSVLERVPSDLNEDERLRAVTYTEDYIKASTTGEGHEQFPTIQPDTDNPSGLLFPAATVSIEKINATSARFPDERYLYESVAVYRYTDVNGVEHGPYLFHGGISSPDGKLEMLSSSIDPIRMG